MSRKTKEDLLEDLTNSVCRANDLAIELAKLQAGVMAIINLVNDSHLNDVEDVTDMLHALVKQ